MEGGDGSGEEGEEGFEGGTGRGIRSGKGPREWES